MRSRTVGTTRGDIGVYSIKIGILKWGVTGSELCSLLNGGAVLQSRKNQAGAAGELQERLHLLRGLCGTF